MSLLYICMLCICCCFEGHYYIRHAVVGPLLCLQLKKKIHFMLKQPFDFMLFFSSMNYVNLAFIIFAKRGGVTASMWHSMAVEAWTASVHMAAMFRPCRNKLLST